MKRFTYTVSDPQGLHARNAVSLCRLAGTFQARIEISVPGTDEKRGRADCKNMIALMGLCARQDTVVEFTIEGEDENAAFDSLAAVIPTIL